MTRRAARSARLLLLASVLLSACSWGTVSLREFENEYGDLSSTPLVGRSLFIRERAQEFVGFVERRLGRGVRLRSLTIYAARASFEAVSTARPGEMDGYFYENGAFTQTFPVRLSGGERLDKELFDLAGAGIDRLPELIERGCAELQPGRGATPYASWSRTGSEIQVAVYCPSPRRSDGYVVFDTKGALRGVIR